MGLISDAQLRDCATELHKSGYGAYIESLLTENDAALPQRN